MPSRDLVEEAARLATICGACRYCEGYCPVFPAIERRREFGRGDVLYLANLCHECRTCYYACPYAPPHEFAVNLPETLSRVRHETYRDFAWPRVLRRLLFGSRVGVTWIALSTVLLTLTLGPWRGEWSSWFSGRVGPGAFYAVIPYAAIVGASSIILLYATVAIAIGVVRFWRETG
jgi:citrate/tricarballylate utilization protein